MQNAATTSRRFALRGVDPGRMDYWRFNQTC
jgi:hypothetical protein